MARDGENSLNRLIQEAETKQAQEQEKKQLKTEAKNASSDYVTTLNIEGKNAGFREKAGLFRSMADNARALWSDFKQKWSQRSEMLRVVPEEDTTKARYEAALQRGQQAVEQASSNAENLAQRGETLAAQRQEIEELGDIWSSQHEGEYETVTETPRAAAAEHTVEAGDEWVNDYKNNRSPEADDDAEHVESSTAKKSAGEAFAEYANRNQEMAQLAEIVRRVNPLMEGNGALAAALESGQLNAGQKKMAMSAIEKLQGMGKWGSKDKQAFEALTKMFESQDKQAPAQEGLGEVFESHAEDLKKKETFSNLGKLIEQHHPLTLDNKVLGQAFESGHPTAEDLANGLKAIQAMRGMGKWDKATAEKLAVASITIKKELEPVQSHKDNVVSIDRKGSKEQEVSRGDVAA